MANIAFLGTGLLGAAFAEAAAKRGDSVTAWNRSADKAQGLAALGIALAGTPAEAVRSASRVHITLKDDAVVDAIIADLRPGLAAGAIAAVLAVFFAAAMMVLAFLASILLALASTAVRARRRAARCRTFDHNNAGGGAEGGREGS